MGLKQAALELTTGEAGTDWVDADDRVIARFAVADIGDGPTAELEIMRGDIARMIYDGVGPHPPEQVLPFRSARRCASARQEAESMPPLSAPCQAKTPIA